MYQYLSGYTAKVAGTELGVTEPTATFSACFGSPFLTVHPTQYAQILGDKMEAFNADAYLVNTGWTGGSYGVGSRISIKATRAIIDGILDGSIEDAEYKTSDVFGFQVPLSLPNFDNTLLDPRSTWEDKDAFDQTAEKLAVQFHENFKKFTGTPLGQQLEQYGPQNL